MKTKHPQLFLLYGAVFLAILGFGMIFPLLPFYAESFGATAFQLGLLAASFSITQFLTSPFIGRLSDRFGRKPILVFALVCTSISFALFGFAQSLAWLFAARILYGVASAGVFPIAVAYIGDITLKEDRVKYVSRLTSMFSLGFLAGPAAGGILASISPSTPFFIAALLTALNAFLMIMLLKESLSVKAEKSVLKEGLLNITRIVGGFRSEFILFFMLLFGWAFAISNMEIAFPLLSQQKFSFSETQIGFVFAGVGTLTTLVQWFLIPFMVKKFKERPTILLGSFLMVLGQTLVGFAWQAGVMLLFLGTSFLGSSLLRPTVQGVLSEETKEGQGTTLGLAFSFESLGRTAGPLIAGVVISLFGLQSQFKVTGFILFLIMLLFAFHLYQKKKQIQ